MVAVYRFPLGPEVLWVRCGGDGLGSALGLPWLPVGEIGCSVPKGVTPTSGAWVRGLHLWTESLHHSLFGWCQLHGQTSLGDAVIPETCTADAAALPPRPGQLCCCFPCILSAQIRWGRDRVTVLGTVLGGDLAEATLGIQSRKKKDLL